MPYIKQLSVNELRDCENVDTELEQFKKYNDDVELEETEWQWVTDAGIGKLSLDVETISDNLYLLLLAEFRRSLVVATLLTGKS